MSDDITKIKGIGPAAAKKYVAAGFSTIESIASADAGALAKVPGVGESRAKGIIANAKELMGGASGAVPPTQDPKPEPKVTPSIAAAKTGRGSLLGNPTVAIPVGLAIALAVIAFTKTDDVSSSNTVASSGSVSTTTGLSQNLNGMQGEAARQQGVGSMTGAPMSADGNVPAVNQPQAGYPYYAPNPYASYSGWNDNAYGNGNTYGNAYGNGRMAMDMNANANANSNVAGQGYGYNNPYYYGSPYAYGPYGYPYPVMNPPAGWTQNSNPN